MTRRKTQWIDNIATAAQSVSSGSVTNSTEISEAEIENVGGGATLIRVVGDICPVTTSTATTGSVTFALWLFAQYTGAVAPTLAAWALNDTYQRKYLLGTWMWRPAGVVGAGIPRSLHIDLRTKRKLGQGLALTLSIGNHTGASMSFTSHLRYLLLLP